MSGGRRVVDCAGDSYEDRVVARSGEHNGRLTTSNCNRLHAIHCHASPSRR
jgi:hypothetical protein